jgi:TatD DNase family protein
VLEQVPLDRLLIETDSPYLTPHPYRGKRNETAYVRLVAEAAAELKGISLEELAEITTNNAIQLLKLR